MNGKYASADVMKSSATLKRLLRSPWAFPPCSPPDGSWLSIRRSGVAILLPLLILQQIHVGALQEVGWLDAELGHQVVRDRLSLRVRLSGPHDHFQFHELTEAFHVIQVNAGLPHQVKVAPLAHGAADAEGPPKRLLEAIRIAGFEDLVVRALRSTLVDALIVDQLCRVRVADAQLEPPLSHQEERIFLRKGLHGHVRQRLGARPDGVKVACPGLDLNVAWHSPDHSWSGPAFGARRK